MLVLPAVIITGLLASVVEKLIIVYVQAVTGYGTTALGNG